MKISRVFKLAARRAEEGYVGPLEKALSDFDVRIWDWGYADERYRAFFNPGEHREMKIKDRPMVFLLLAAIAESEGD